MSLIAEHYMTRSALDRASRVLDGETLEVVANWADDYRRDHPETDRALRGIRRTRGLSQHDLVDKSGYHRTYIGLLERGQKSPSLRSIFNLATTLQVSPSRIVRMVEGQFGRVQRKGQRRKESA